MTGRGRDRPRVDGAGAARYREVAGVARAGTVPVVVAAVAFFVWPARADEPVDEPVGDVASVRASTPMDGYLRAVDEFGAGLSLTSEQQRRFGDLRSALRRVATDEGTGVALGDPFSPRALDGTSPRGATSADWYAASDAGSRFYESLYPPQRDRLTRAWGRLFAPLLYAPEGWLLPRRRGK